jgi:hypothetical protein
VRRRLVGDDVGPDPAGARTAREVGHDVGGVAEQAHRDGGLARHGVRDDRERLVERLGAPVEVARAQSRVDPRRLAFDGEHRRAGEHARERLRAAHAAEPGGEGDRAGQRAPEPLVGDGRERLERPLQDALRPDVDP